MPDNAAPGAIEDFVWGLVDANAVLAQRALGAVNDIPAAERLFKEDHTTKAVLHTWLAWQVEPGTPSGQAISRGWADGQHPTALAFMGWLQALFSHPEGAR